jgi:hypothetical protein
MVYDNDGPIYSVLTGTKGSPCGTRTLTCFDFGGETNWAMTNVDMGGCNCTNSTPDTGPISDPPCTVGDTYTFHHYCA